MEHDKEAPCTNCGRPACICAEFMDTDYELVSQNTDTPSPVNLSPHSKRRASR